MKHASIILILLVASACLAEETQRETPQQRQGRAAKKPRDVPPQTSGAPARRAEDNVVPEERAALAELKRIDAIYRVSPDRHITEVELWSRNVENKQELDLAFLAPLEHFKDLSIGDRRVTAEGMKVLLRLKPLEFLCLMGPEFRDEHLAVVADCRQIRRMTLATPNVTAAGIAKLEKLPHLEYLSIGREIDDAKFSGISHLVHLKTLEMTNCYISNSGLKALEGLVKLEELEFVPETDAGFAHLQKLVKLRRIVPTFIGDRGLYFLRNCAQLEELDISERPVSDEGVRLGEPPVTDQGAKYLRGMTNLRSLNLGNTKITDSALANLRRMTKLKTLSLAFDAIEGDGLANLKGLGELRSLDLSATKVRARGLIHLAALPKLDSLNLVQCDNLTDEDVAALGGMKALRKLDLGSCLKITDRSAETLAGISTLEEINLGMTALGDAGVAKLSALKHLTTINLAYTDVTDAGVAHLKAFRDLRSVNLKYTPLSDASVNVLKLLGGLDYLWIESTNITEAAYGELKRALPNTQIHWSPGKYRRVRPDANGRRPPPDHHFL